MLSIELQPFLKWPGGKRWLVERIISNISLEPGKRYIEPFLGSGVLFFALQPQQAIISDLNRELIELFLVMRDKPDELKKRISHLTKLIKSFQPSSTTSGFVI